MINAKYANVSNSIVNYEDGEGNNVSSLATTPEIVDYLQQGGVITAYEIIKVSEVSMRQARAALITNNLFTQVDSAIKSMTGTEGLLAQNYWEYSPVVRKDSPLVISVTTQLNLTSAQVDELFDLASTL